MSSYYQLHVTVTEVAVLIISSLIMTKIIIEEATKVLILVRKPGNQGEATR